jgi:hypothetical protein
MTLRGITSFEQLPGDKNTSGSYAMLVALGFAFADTGTYYDAPAGRRTGTKALQGPQIFVTGNTWMEWTLPVVFGKTASQHLLGVGTTTMYCGFAVKFPNAANPSSWASGNPFIDFRDDAGGFLGGVVMSAGKTQIVDNNGTVLGSQSSTAPFTSTSAWYFCEVSITATGTTGPTITFKVDGVQQCSAAIVGGLNAVVAALRWNWSRAADWPIFDDIYLCDSQGSLNNGFLGDCRVEYVDAASAGADQNWDLGAGASHIAAVTGTDVTDAGYIRSAGLNVTETFVLDNLAITPTSILGVQVSNIAKRESGTGQLSGVVRIGGTDYLGSLGTVPISGAYQLAPGILEEDPSTSAAWTKSAIDGMEAGPVVTS